MGVLKTPPQHEPAADKGGQGGVLTRSKQLPMARRSRSASPICEKKGEWAGKMRSWGRGRRKRRRCGQRKSRAIVQDHETIPTRSSLAGKKQRPERCVMNHYISLDCLAQ